MAFLNTSRFRLGTAIGLLLVMSVTARAEDKAPEAPKPAAATVFDAASVDTFSGAILAARTADNDYDYDTAVQLYRTALRYDPENIEVRERLMVSLFMGGRFDEGVKEADILKDDPAVARIATIARAIDGIRNKDYKKAYDLLKYDGPNELDRMVNSLIAAWGQFGEGKTKEAVAAAGGLEGPDWYAVFRNYSAGAIAAAAGDIDTARRKFSETVADREQGAAASDLYMRAVMALATIEAKAGNKQKALDSISAGEAFAPNYMPLQAFRKQIEAGKVPELAVKSVEQGMASVLFAVGGALNQSLTNAPDRQSAQDIVSFYLVTSYALDPAADTAVLLGGLAEGLEQPERAIKWYSQVAPDSPLRRIAELQLGLNLANTGKVAEAKAHLESAVAADPNDLRGYIAYGSFLSDQKNYVEMAKVYDKAIEIVGPLPKRTDWSVFFQRGIAYERLKKWDLAEPNFKKALELFPDQPQVLNYLGYSWVDMNMNLDEGLNMIRKAVDLRPDDGYIVDSLGWAYFRLGRFDDAVVELERAVELKAADATLNDHLGDAYWRVGRKLEAIFQWRTAIELKPEPGEQPKIEKKIREGLPELPTKAEAPKAATTEVAGNDKVPAAPQSANDMEDEPATGQSEHTVAKGDSLWNIARDLLGDGQRYHEIIDLNPGLKRNPDILQPGQMLKLPAAKP
ncbi:MAG: hypothetical protein RLZZ444_2702 [Pseudomonadota bacterium]|jgi:tetratricopeptide (TPR) repeat protein